MFSIGCHNVTDVHTVRITKGLGDEEGYLTLCFHSLPFYDGEEETSNEYTFYMKNLEEGYESLLAALQKGMRAFDAEESVRYREIEARKKNDG
jgi:hypothetical protein